MSKYQSLVVLTGSGISAESGIKTFRAADGLWEDHRIEDVATPEAFHRDPETVQRFYNERRNQLLHNDIHPNSAHRALADLEKKFKGDFLLVTQNIDNLHEGSGSKNIIHMHGELLKMRCSESDEIFSIKNDISITDKCICCQKIGSLRPHVVWFGELPLLMDTIYSALEQCDLFIAIGTSGNVYPAAGFVQVAQQALTHTVELNLEPSAVGSDFKEKIYGPATKVVPAYVSKILSLQDMH